MKKKNLTTLTIVTLLLVLVTLIGVSGTYAKYTTSVSGKAQAIVAKWAFSAETTDGTLDTDTQTYTIDLGETATTGYVIVDNVKRIYPGATGTIEFAIDNEDSDVDAELSVLAEAVTDSIFTKEQFSIEVTGVTGTQVEPTV